MLNFTSGLVFADADEYLLQSVLLVEMAAIHPHGNSIFLFDSLQGKLISYSMDSQRVHVIRSVTKSPYFWSISTVCSTLPRDGSTAKLELLGLCLVPKNFAK